MIFSGRNYPAISLASLRIAWRGTPGVRGCSFGIDSGRFRGMRTSCPDPAIQANFEIVASGNGPKARQLHTADSPARRARVSLR
jgi:hypothetical protein